MKGRRATLIRRLRFNRHKLVRSLQRRRNRSALIAGALVLALAIVIPVHLFMPPQVNPTAYTPLLNTIAAGESGGNYNAYFGHGGNTTIRFTDMSVGQVLQWQEQYVQSGSISSAVGRYQFLRPTLEGLVAEQHISQSAKFDPALQDRLAIALMERRGSVAYVYKKISRQQFTANLAKEWASLPRMTGPNPTQSYYAGDGVNVARVSIATINQAADLLRTKAK